uniref:Uncharacterized protein n=1 Tax=Timema cristinae TaxID=61476 RepID=A0A7R9CXK9_TIMCR|nr:unnamed protein product [Timema cristinae]
MALSFITFKKINYLYVVSFLLVIYNFTESSDSVEETSMMDWTDICVDGFEKSVFLTVGMGISDSSVLLFSENTAILDCSIEIQTSDENVLLIVVMEFPDKKKDEESCVNPYDNTRSIIELEAITIPNNKTSVCDNINEEEEGTSIVHYILATNKVTIRLYSEGTFETMKVTSTATKRVASGGRCDEETELRCRLTESNRTTIDMCLSKELLCDGNANCGERNLHDEDPKICEASKTSHLWLVVTAGMFMMAVLVFFLVRLLRSCVPRVGDHFFIFNANEDNRLNLYPIFMKPPSPQTTDLRKTSSSRMKKVPLSHERRLSFAPKHELASYVFTEQDRAGSEIILKTSSLTSDDTALTFEDEHEQIPVNKKPALPVNKLDERKTKSSFSFSHVPVRLETEIPRELRSSLKNQEGRKKERDDHSFQVQVDVYSPPPFSKLS